MSDENKDQKKEETKPTKQPETPEYVYSTEKAGMVPVDDSNSSRTDNSGKTETSKTDSR